jgi:hypothetical protein
MITRIDSTALRILSEAALTAVRAALEPHGITVAHGRSTYTNGPLATLKFEIAAKAADGEETTREAEDFKALAYRYNMKASDLGRTFENGGRRYKLLGLRSKATAAPFIGEDLATGRRYKFRDVRKDFVDG